MDAATELTFGQIANELRAAAAVEAMGIEAVEMLNAQLSVQADREPSEGTLAFGRIASMTLGSCRIHAGAIAEAYRIFQALAPHEATIRALIGAKS